jgi:hypothetical protein
MAPSIRKKLALTSLTSGGRSVGIVRLRTEAKEFFFMSMVRSTGNYCFRTGIKMKIKLFPCLINEAPRLAGVWMSRSIASS